MRSTGQNIHGLGTGLVLRFVTGLTLLLCQGVAAGTSLSEGDKRYIHEIRCPGGEWGTGFMVSDSTLGTVLVTCGHVVEDSTGNLYDSVFVRRNKRLSSGKVISDTSSYTVRTWHGTDVRIVRHPNPNVDLALILVNTNTSTLRYDEELFAYPSNLLPDRKQWNNLGIDEGSEVEMVGFAFAAGFDENTAHYHVSRFGRIGLYVGEPFPLRIDSQLVIAEFVLLDMSSRPGDSGSPIYLTSDVSHLLVGFVSAVIRGYELSIVYPSFYLKEMLAQTELAK